MFNISDLEIAIITYNRANYLKKTLESIFAEHSPTKTCSVCVYDNHSTDDTPSILAEYAQKYPNFSFVSNRRNIGLSGNICKAFENATYKYIWILCDNDKIDWQYWPSVVKGLQEEHDIVLAARFFISPHKEASVGLKLAQITFLPSAIYKTEYLTDEVMSWTCNNTYTVLPHLTLACAIVNNGADIYVPENSVITMQDNPETIKEKNWEEANSLDRVTQTKKHPKANGFAFEACEVNSCSFLNDVKYVREFVEVLSNSKCMNNFGPFFIVHRAIRRYFEGKNSYSNLMDIYPVLSCTQKFSFWAYFFVAGILYCLGLKRKK